MLTNAEKITEAIARGAKNILIHPIPTSTLWIVCEKHTQGWKMTICNPFGTAYQLLGDNISDDNHVLLWVEMLKIRSPVDITHNMMI